VDDAPQSINNAHGEKIFLVLVKKRCVIALAGVITASVHIACLTAQAFGSQAFVNTLEYHYVSLDIFCLTSLVL
jgi:hypothetical protein